MKVKIVSAILGGLLLGAVAAWLLAARLTGKVFTAQYFAAVADQANVALYIRAGKQMALLTNIEARLPEYVLEVDRDFRGYAASTNALWLIKAYYERNEIPVPPEIRSILDSLPPKPPTACQIRLRALDAAAPTASVSLTPEQAQSAAVLLANSKASALYHCQPFSASRAPRFS